MSASDKKKLRKEENTAKLTERQRQQQKEDKKLKVYTVTFITSLVVIVCLALGILFWQNYVNSGTAEKTTITATVGDNKINTVEMSYYYNDAINNLYSSIYSGDNAYADYYFEAMGLDVGTKLTEQTNPETGDTWANYFIDSALETAQNDYALAALAQEAGFTLPEEEKTSLETSLSNIETSAMLSGYGTGDKYLQAIYGFGASLDSYRTYLERSALANAYYTHYYESLTFTNDDIRAEEKENGVDAYNSYTYLDCYLSYTDFLEGGKEDENGSKTYTDEEKDAARAKLKTAAEKLAAATTEEELKKLAEEAEVNESSQLAVNQETNDLHSSMDAKLADWMAAEDRKPGDIGMIENTAADDDKVVNGYHVVLFQSKNDNTEKMDNVRHLLVAYEGGHLDETTNETVYTEAEKTVAMNDAKKLLDEWKNGKADEESFIALVKEHSDDEASVEDGGLYEDINHSSQYMETFRDWAIDPARKVGDSGLVETDYGVHIMYYVGNSDTSYRDYMITEDLRSAALEKWYDEALKTMPIAKLDMSKLKADVTLSY